MTGPDSIRDVFIDAAKRAVDVVEDDRVSNSWDGPSSLEGYSIGELAAHLCRAIVTVDGYLNAGSASIADGSDLDAPDYFLFALGDHDPIDSDHHHGIRQRSADMAASGRSDVLDATRGALDRLSVALPVTGSPFTLSVFGGARMELDEYLRTRIVELCVHTDDLAASIDGLEAELSAEAWRVARETLVELAARKSGDRELALGLSRRERTDRPLAL